MKAIIGINYGSGHDASAALIVDGKLLAVGEEERFSRLKHDSRFPRRSIDFCLKKAGISHADVTHACIGWDPYVHFGKRIWFVLAGGAPQGLWRRLKFVRALTVIAYEAIAQAKAAFPNAQVSTVEHHVAHAASSYFTSPFEDAAIISWDGRGEWSTGLLLHAQGNRLSILDGMYFPYSIGMMYTAFTHYLGFESNDEYKVMGLSAYGQPVYTDRIMKIINGGQSGLGSIDLGFFQHPGFSSNTGWGERYFTSRLESEFGPARKAGEPINKHYEDMAASLQMAFNNLGIAVAERLRKRTGAKNLCITGGVGLNGVMNMYIINKAGFEKCHFIPAPDDAGVALGAAIWVHNVALGQKERVALTTPYWGVSFTDEEIKKEIDSYRYRNVVELANPAKTAAELLAKGNIIGWFQGRAEFGPRALGCRSILGDPRPAEFKDVVNARIKFREEFRPFAPSVLADHAKDYFDLPDDSPYMLQICQVKKDKQGIIQAVTHVNGSARPQTVRRETNPLYYDLISNFFELTGIPLVLNTSFNVKGEPIVNSPADAIRCFYATGLDYLIVGKYLFHKNLNPDQLG